MEAQARLAGWQPVVKMDALMFASRYFCKEDREDALVKLVISFPNTAKVMLECAGAVSSLELYAVDLEALITRVSVQGGRRLSRRLEAWLHASRCNRAAARLRAVR